MKKTFNGRIKFRFMYTSGMNNVYSSLFCMTGGCTPCTQDVHLQRMLLLCMWKLSILCHCWRSHRKCYWLYQWHVSINVSNMWLLMSVACECLYQWHVNINVSDIWILMSIVCEYLYQWNVTINICNMILYVSDKLVFIYNFISLQRVL